MEYNEPDTLQTILQTAKQEFLEKGFRDASLRRIVITAGVTTGALYGYFKSKEELFSALVKESADRCMLVFQNAQTAFSELQPKEQMQQMGVGSQDCMSWMVDYIYEHFDTFKLLICCSEGTAYEQFIDRMVEIETVYTHRFLRVLEQEGHSCRRIDPQLEHILISGMFSAFFEIVRHDMSKQESIQFVEELQEFYTAGWTRIMGL